MLPGFGHNVICPNGNQWVVNGWSNGDLTGIILDIHIYIYIMYMNIFIDIYGYTIYVYVHI